MDGIRRRRTALVLMVLAMAVIVTSHVALRRGTVDARATAADLSADLEDVEDDIGELAAEELRLQAGQVVADRQLRNAVDRIDVARDAETAELERLRQRTEERDATQGELDFLHASVAVASGQAEDNEALLQALDRCLDGATRAANALSVGDVHRALANVADVRDACDQVGVVINP